MGPRVSRPTAGVVIALSFLILTALPAGADDLGDRRAEAINDGENLEALARDQVPGIPGIPANENNQGDDGGPNCTRSDGTPDYLRFGPRLFSTMEEQRSTYHPDEQRPGEWLHLYCGDEWLDFVFIPDGEEEPVVDPRTLAETVRITPPDPVLVTSPAATEQLVDIEVWFWVETWEPLSADASAGDVSVTVSAVPSTLIIDPGDGSPTFECSGPQAVYDPALPADAQSSDCTHTYTRAGNYTATATLVYDTSFTSNVPGAGGGLGTIETTSTLDLAVAEAQAINTQAGG